MKRGSVSIRLNRSRLIVALSVPVLLVVALAVARAQDIEMSGADSEVLYVRNTYSGSSEHRSAVYGQANENNNHGYGGYFTGGKAGVVGEGTKSGGGTHYGVRGLASGGNYSNRGIYGSASGNDPWGGYFDGNVYTTGTYEDSDERLKDEIIDLDGSLDLVMDLEPKSFRFRTEEYPMMNLPEGYHMGLIAQEVEQILPDLVREISVPEDEAGNGTENTYETFLALKYGELIPVLIGAIQEQQWQIEELRAEVAALSRKK